MLISKLSPKLSVNLQFPTKHRCICLRLERRHLYVYIWCHLFCCLSFICSLNAIAHKPFRWYFVNTICLGVEPGSTNLVNAQDQEGVNGGGGTSPFSSALWAFMDSIPSTPASACEGPINRTFVRMSSFSRIRYSKKANGTPPVTSTVAAKKRSRNRGFLLLSIVGALCAIFWVFIATVRASGRPVLSWKVVLLNQIYLSYM